MTQTEPTFRIAIKACQFEKLTVEQLISKLKLMNQAGFTTNFYTILQDTENLPEISPKKGLPPGIENL